MVGTDLEVGRVCRDLYYNDLTGTIPTTVGLLTSMTWLYASYHIPPCMSR